MASFTYEPPSLSSLVWIARNLRDDDLLEIAYGLPGEDPVSVLLTQVALDPTAMVAFYGEEPVAVLGCNDGRPWMLGSVKLNAIPLAMTREAIRLRDLWLGEHGVLMNRVLRHATTNVDWLKRIGFEMVPSADPDYLKFSMEQTYVPV